MVETEAKAFDPTKCTDKNLLIKKALDLQKSVEKKERQLESERAIAREFNASLKKKPEEDNQIRKVTD